MIAILTALEVEHAAVRSRLSGVEPHDHDAGTRFDVGVLTSSPDRRVVLACTGPGNLPAATITERVVARFRPAALMFVGVAGGLREWTELGDVVVATRVYAYHGGRTEGEEHLVRPRAWDLAHGVEQTARRLARSFAWREPLPETGPGATPAVHFGPIAAGEVVHDSTDSVEAHRLRTSFNDAIAVDMESAGFALAGHLNKSVPAVTVRAVSDPADGSKDAADRDDWHPVAARNAAAFAVALAAALDDGTEEPPAPGERSAPEPPVVHNRNIARDNARVGQQTGINLGGYHGPDPTGARR